jgi:hypothetical protein
MRLRQNRQTVFGMLLWLLWMAAQHYLVALFCGVGRAIVFLVFASLLLFLVVRSADICRLLVACFEAIGFELLAPLLAEVHARHVAPVFVASRKPACRSASSFPRLFPHTDGI